jgi:hypothetical protein
MEDREFGVVMGLYLIGALMILLMGRASHVSGMLAWVVLVVVMAPMPVLFLQRWLRFPERLVLLAAYQAVAVFGIAALLVLAVACISALRWIGLL